LLRLLDVSDGIYIRTAEGWLYLAVILDLFTRKVVGWAMRDHLRAELTIAALTMAIQRRRPAAGLIHHSDRGSQGGFKRLSQHHDEGGCGDHSKAAIGSICEGAIAVPRATASGRTR
jgi:transposase InsO family protein